MNVRTEDEPTIVRGWRIEDLPDVRRIMWDTWLATYASFIPLEDLRGYLDEHYSLQALTELFHAPDVNGFIAEVAGTAAGCERTSFNNADRRFYISSLYILPLYQGRGLGGQLLKEAEQCARTYGATAVWLGVMEQNAGALAWYRKLGFEFIEESPFTMGHTTVNHLIGYKNIHLR